MAYKPLSSLMCHHHHEPLQSCLCPSNNPYVSSRERSSHSSMARWCAMIDFCTSIMGQPTTYWDVRTLSSTSTWRSTTLLKLVMVWTSQLKDSTLCYSWARPVSTSLSWGYTSSEANHHQHYPWPSQWRQPWCPPQAQHPSIYDDKSYLIMRVQCLMNRLYQVYVNIGWLLFWLHMLAIVHGYGIRTMVISTSMHGLPHVEHVHRLYTDYITIKLKRSMFPLQA